MGGSDRPLGGGVSAMDIPTCQRGTLSCVSFVVFLSSFPIMSIPTRSIIAINAGGNTEVDSLGTVFEQDRYAAAHLCAAGVAAVVLSLAWPGQVLPSPLTRTLAAAQLPHGRLGIREGEGDSDQRHGLSRNIPGQA